jgi:hypothetical protein
MEPHLQPPVGDERHLQQPGRTGLPQRPRQPPTAADDDVAGEDFDLDVVVRL